MFTDPDGREYLVCGPNGNDGKCTRVSDEAFAAERNKLKKDGNVYTGSGNFYESGQIKNADGGVVATYVQFSIDDLQHRQLAAIASAVDPIPMATVQFFGLSLVAGATGGAAFYALTPYLAPTVTTLGLGTSTTATAAPSAVGAAFSQATLRAFQRQLAQHGRAALEKSLASFGKRLAEHLVKIEAARRAGGYTSSMEKEVKIFRESIAAIKQILGK